jgi:hypothetical protein
MIKRAIQFSKILWRGFASNTETQAKQELLSMIDASRTSKSIKPEPLKHIKLVELEVKKTDNLNEPMDWMKKAVLSLKTEETFAKFFDENQEIIKNDLNIAILDQIFNIFKRLKRAGSMITINSFVEKPTIKPAFQAIIGRFKDMSISQLAALVHSLYKNQYYDQEFFIQIENHLANQQHNLKFMLSLNTYLRVLCTLKDAGLTLTIKPKHVNDLVNRQLPYYYEQPCAKVAGLICNYHKIMCQLAEQFYDDLKLTKRLTIEHQSQLDKRLNLKEDTDKEVEYAFESSISKNKNQRLEIKQKLMSAGIHLIDFGPLLRETIISFDLPALSMTLNSYSMIKEGKDNPTVQLLVQKLLSTVQLKTVKDILDVLQACVNVGIQNPEVFKEIIERSTELLAELELAPQQECVPKDWLMIHFYLVKYDVCFCFNIDSRSRLAV